MIPGTYMIFRGISDDQQRADLIAFLKLAAAPGGGEAVVAQNIVPPEFVAGQRPEPLTQVPPDSKSRKSGIAATPTSSRRRMGRRRRFGK